MLINLREIFPSKMPLLGETSLSKSRKLKILDRLSREESHKLIKRNYKLINLDLNNLSHTQVQKIDEKIENPSLLNDNIGVHKLLNEHGIINIDILKSKFLFKNIK